MNDTEPKAALRQRLSDMAAGACWWSNRYRIDRLTREQKRCFMFAAFDAFGPMIPVDEIHTLDAAVSWLWDRGVTH